MTYIDISFDGLSAFRDATATLTLEGEKEFGSILPKVLIAPCSRFVELLGTRD